MARVAHFIGFAFLIVATLATGLVHGRLTNRWGAPPDAKHAANQFMPALPTECGNWKMVRPLEISPEALRMLQSPSYVSRTYVHEQTGDEITVFVLLGQPGPVSVHVPEVCYSSQDYSISGERLKKQIQLDSGAHEFWELPMKANNPLRGGQFRVYYAWSSGTTWEAADRPRFSFGGLSHLYKLQMSITTHPGPQAKDFDPAQDFLKNFLTQLQPRLVEASHRSGSSS